MNTFQELYDAGEALRRGHHRKAASHIDAAVKAFQAHEKRDNEWIALIERLRGELAVTQDLLIAREGTIAEHERVDRWKEQSLALATLELGRSPRLADVAGGEVVGLARDVLNAVLFPDVVEAATRKAPERMSELFVIQMDPSA